MKKIIVIACSLYSFNMYAADIQLKPVIVNQKLVEKISGITPSSSNAHDLEEMLGSPIACLPSSDGFSESWKCQWKGDMMSSRLVNTLNISFEAGMITSIVAIDSNGNFLTRKLSGKKRTS